jgi:hypothetical protein
VLSAVSILLGAVFRQLARTQSALDNLFAHIDRAIEVLKTMEESAVARNSTLIVIRTLARAKKVPQPVIDAQQLAPQRIDAFDVDLELPWIGSGQQPTPASDAVQQVNAVGDDVLRPGEEYDWMSALLDNSQQTLLWAEWIRELESLDHAK